MIKYYSQQELLEKAYETLVPLTSQKETCKSVASLIASHLTYLRGLDNGYKPCELPSNSMLIIGRTGCGKSEIFKKIGAVCGLQVGIVDASNLSAAGWKGMDLNDAVYNAISLTHDPEAFKHDGGIIIFDEIDKLAYNNPNYIEGNAQPSFLKLLEKDFTIQANTKDASSIINIPTERILFVFTGVFTRLEEQLKKKHSTTHNIGFLSESLSNKQEIDYLKHATMKDLEEFGIMGELLGRIGTLQYIPPLTPEDYVTLIKGHGNSLQTLYRNAFNIHGVTFNISDAACRLIGERASKLPSGARSLFPIMRQELMPAFTKIDNDMSISSVTLCVKDNNLHLKYETTASRTPLTNKTDIETEVDFPDLKLYLTAEGGIYHVCEEFLDMAELRNNELKASFFYCMQTISRYLALETNLEDQRFQSYIKLVNCMPRKDSDESVFDILMKDAKEHASLKSEAARNSYAHMETFYNLFRTISNDDTIGNILRLLHYIENHLKNNDSKK